MTAGSPALAPAAARDRGEPHKYVIAAAVILASVMQVIDTSIVNVAIPHMMGELGASIDQIAWVSTGYILASVIVMPMTGWLAGFFGRKRYLATSIVIFTLASFFCGASDTLGTLVFWRIVQGIGGGALMATSQFVLYEAFPREEAGTAMALFGVGVMIGPTIGPTLGGWLTDNYSWPWIFFINLPVGAAAAAMVVAYVHDTPNQVRARSIDYVGIALLVVCVSALQYMLEHGQSEDWFDSPLITMLAVVGAVSAVLLVWRELTVAEPIIDFRVLRYRETSIGVVLGVVLGVALFGSVFVLPIFLQGMLHMTAWQTGWVLFPGAVATAVSMGVAGRLSQRFDPRLLIAIGMVLFFVAMLDMARLSLGAGANDFYWPLILRGLGLGLIFVPLTTVTLADLHMRELAQGTALSSFLRQLGGSFGIAAMASLLTRYADQARVALTTHVGATDPLTLERVSALTRAFVARGADAESARGMALAAINGQIQVQASIIAFNKVFLASGVLLLATLPLLLFVRHARAGAGAAPVHAE